VILNIFNVHPEPWGRWTHFDAHIFQMGWFNHQLGSNFHVFLSHFETSLSFGKNSFRRLDGPHHGPLGHWKWKLLPSHRQAAHPSTLIWWPWDVCDLIDFYLVVSITPLKFNMVPENDGFQKESPFPGTSFSGSMLNFRGVTHLVRCSSQENDPIFEYVLFGLKP